jgi:transcriptional regulator with XRE-family HTH domain
MSRKQKPADELRELIAAAGMTQREAAEALGKTQRIVAYWLSGEQEVPRMAILAMRWIVEHAPAQSQL